MVLKFKNGRYRAQNQHYWLIPYFPEHYSLTSAKEPS